MPPRVIPPSPQRAPFYPPSDAATYRDLLFFEERLKTNAASLKRRKTRYQRALLEISSLDQSRLTARKIQTSLSGPTRDCHHLSSL